MSIWDSITSTAGDLYDSASSTVGSAASAVYKQANGLADSLTKVTAGVSVPWDTHTGASGTPVVETATPGKKPPVGLILGVIVIGLGGLWLTRKKGA